MVVVVRKNAQAIYRAWIKFLLLHHLEELFRPRTLRDAYLQPVDNNRCRCPALLIEWMCTYPLWLWCVTAKKKARENVALPMPFAAT